jgi:hypothetical protein
VTRSPRSAYHRRALAVLLLALGLTAGSVAGELTPALASAAPAWRIEHYLPDGHLVENSAISATGPGNVWAVASGKFGALAVTRFDGSHWIAEPTPANLAGGPSIVGVAGSSADNMWLVGQATVLEADQWTGSSWKQHAVPGLAASSGTAIAAPARGGAWVFGSASGPTQSGPWAEHLAGGRWTGMAVPGDVLSVTALTSHDIWALANSKKTAGATVNHWHLILMHWNGHQWSSVSAPTARLRSGKTTEALSFAAIGPRDVWAIAVPTVNPCGCGTEPPGLLLEHWNGHRWSVTELRKDTGVAGPVADGRGGLWFATESGGKLVFVHVHGGHETNYPVPRARGKATDVEAMASVPGTTRVWAAGSYGNGRAARGVLLDYAP